MLLIFNNKLLGPFGHLLHAYVKAFETWPCVIDRVVVPPLPPSGLYDGFERLTNFIQTYDGNNGAAFVENNLIATYFLIRMKTRYIEGLYMWELKSYLIWIVNELQLTHSPAKSACMICCSFPVLPLHCALISLSDNMNITKCLKLQRLKCATLHGVCNSRGHMHVRCYRRPYSIQNIMFIAVNLVPRPNCP